MYRLQKLRPPSRALLKVSNLTIRLATDSGLLVTPVEDVSFGLNAGEVLGLLGESGAGKSTLALALLRILPNGFRAESGSIEFDGRTVDCTLRNRSQIGAALSVTSGIIPPTLEPGSCPLNVDYGIEAFGIAFYLVLRALVAGYDGPPSLKQSETSPHVVRH